MVVATAGLIGEDEEHRGGRVAGVFDCASERRVRTFFAARAGKLEAWGDELVRN